MTALYRATTRPPGLTSHTPRPWTQPARARPRSCRDRIADELMAALSYLQGSISARQDRHVGARSRPRATALWCRTRAASPCSWRVRGRLDCHRRNPRHPDRRECSMTLPSVGGAVHNLYAVTASCTRSPHRAHQRSCIWLLGCGQVGVLLKPGQGSLELDVPDTEPSTLVSLHEEPGGCRQERISSTVIVQTWPTPSATLWATAGMAWF
jgi:hypothetical protein